MEQEDRLISIKEAALTLGVSVDTVRRRIKRKELGAEKYNGAYGEQYFIRQNDLAEAQQITDVVQVSQQISPQELQNLIRQAVQQAMASQQSKIDSLESEVKALREELATQKQITSNNKKPWWKFW